MSKPKSQTPQSPTFPIEPTAKATPPDIEGMLNKMTIQSIRKERCELPEPTGKGRGQASQRG